MRVGLIIPTRNAGEKWRYCLEAIAKQTLQPHGRLVIDSSSIDSTVELAREFGFTVCQVNHAQFDHGGTRQLGAELLPNVDLLIYMTQDAVLAASDAIELLVSAFADPKVGVAYGRQLPNLEANPIEAHARLFNYREHSEIRTMQDARSKGLRTAFNSNSFACYRRPALEQVGGFPKKIIFGEDTFVAAKMLLSGWKIAYVAEARAYHSHNYTLRQEFERYFDIGVFHAREGWLLEVFGKPEGEGLRFLRSEISYLLKKAPQKIPSALLRNALKYIAYRLGRMEAMLPIQLKQSLAMNKAYFSSKC